MPCACPASPAELLPGACGDDCGCNPPLNLIRISLDALRADHLSGYGYARQTSPTIDRELLAAALRDDARTAAAFTEDGYVPTLYEFSQGFLSRIEHPLSIQGRGTQIFEAGAAFLRAHVAPADPC